jgi:integrase
LNDLEEAIQRAYKELHVLPTSDWLNSVIDKFRYPGKYKTKPVTLFSFMQDFIDTSPTRIIPKTGRPATYKTYRDYNKLFEDLKEFAAVKEIDFCDINKDLYSDFVSYLTYEKKLSKNTIGKKIRVLKTFLNAATPEHLSRDQFKDSKSISEESENIYLNEKELQAMYELDLTDKPRLDKVRDLFLVGCWTGLRFSDLIQVRPENIKNGLISVTQKKTGNKAVIPLHQTVQMILDKYENNLPKPISNQNFNKYLKEVAELAEFKEGISKQITRGGKKETSFALKWELVTTHTARRSFATNAYKAGVPSLTIMAITGHRSESAFLKYIKVTLEEHAQKIKEIWLKSENHLKVAR